MAKQNYMTVADTVQDMFNEFVSIKEIRKTTTLNDVIEMYMLTKDEKIFLKLKKKYLNVEEIKTMSDETMSDETMSNETMSDETMSDETMSNDRDNNSENVVPEFLFVKLGKSVTNNDITLDGERTMKAYQENEKLNGYTWFSTQALFNGMSQKRIDYYNKAIDNGKIVKILFAVNNDNFDNDIAYSSEVLKVKSDKTPMECPDNCIPIEYKGEQARIWFKLKHIVLETKINASMLMIASSKKDLKQTISKTQYHFGYVSYKK